VNQLSDDTDESAFPSSESITAGFATSGLAVIALFLTAPKNIFTVGGEALCLRPPDQPRSELLNFKGRGDLFL
jgi:hypothetical protein